jgi:hypothetical protein
MDLTLYIWSILDVIDKLPQSYREAVLSKRRSYKVSTSCMFETYVPYPHAVLVCESLQHAISQLWNIYQNAPESAHKQLISRLVVNAVPVHESVTDIDQLLAKLCL